MRWILAVAILGLFQATPMSHAQEFNTWNVECEPGRPLSSNKCRLAYYAKKEYGIVVSMFSYIDRQITFLISAEEHFTQAEITVDGKQIFFTQLCGEGYCFFEGPMAKQLARQFRRGNYVEIEVSALSFGTIVTQGMDLSGFRAALTEFETNRRQR